MQGQKPIVAFDFDGVIHSYKSGWQGADTIPDPPVEGINEAIQEIRKQYRVEVFSSRCHQPGGLEAIEAYLALKGIEVDAVVTVKPPAYVIIDDRAITFDGDSKTLLNKIVKFVPWHKREV